MVRELKLQGCLEYVEPQAAFSFLFGDDRFIKRYHKEQNEDPDAEVSSWTEDGHRTVKFEAPLCAPNVIRKIIGVDTLKVCEVQEYERVGNCFTIRSDPTVERPDGFTTHAELILAPGDNGKGCAVAMNVTLECTVGVWGVQGSLENFMEIKAKKSFIGWMKTARIFCKEQLALTSGTPVPTFEEIEDAHQEASEEEYFEFGDETDTEFLDAGNGSLGRTSSQDGEINVERWIMKSVMSELHGLHITCDATRGHLEKLNRQLQKVNEDFLKLNPMLQKIDGDLVRVHSHLNDGVYVPQRVVWGLLGLGLATGLLLGAGHLCLRSARGS